MVAAVAPAYEDDRATLPELVVEPMMPLQVQAQALPPPPESPLYYADHTPKVVAMRPMAVDDIEQVRELHEQWFPIKYQQSFYDGAAQGVWRETGFPLFTRLAAEEQQPSRFSFVSDDTAAAFGVAELSPRPPTVYGAVMASTIPLTSVEDHALLAADDYVHTHAMYILTLGSRAAVRRRGVASALLAECIAAARRQPKCGAVYLHVKADNLSALRFYEKNGFRNLRFLQDYYVIDGVRHSAYLYILYVNGAEPQSGWLELLTKPILALFSMASQGLKKLLEGVLEETSDKRAPGWRKPLAPTAPPLVDDMHVSHLPSTAPPSNAPVVSRAVNAAMMTRNCVHDRQTLHRHKEAEMELDATTIERIGAIIASLQQSGRLDGSLRLYRTRRGEFVRVLDDDTAPLTAGMLRAIELYTQSDTRSAWVDKVAVDGLAEETKSEKNDELEDHRADDGVATAGDVQSTSKGGEGNGDGDGGGDLAMEQATVEEQETLGGLASAGVKVSAWLSGQDHAPLSAIQDDDPLNLCQATAAPNTPAASDVPQASPPTLVPMETLMVQWPPALTERTRLCYAARDAPSSLSPRCVIYWMRNMRRIAQGNFALAAAMKIAKSHQLPVVALCLVPSSIMFPLRHASGINDAVSRWSIEAVRRRLAEDLRIELLAFTPKESWSRSQTPGLMTPLDAGLALYTLLDALAPAAVVTDDGFSLSARAEVDAVRQFLQTRVRASWSLLAVDSMTCVPFQSQSEAVRKSLDTATAPFLSEDQFSIEYSSLLQQHNQFSIAFPQPLPSFQTFLPMDAKNAFNEAAKKVQVEEVLWEVVEAINAQSASTLASASERVAIDRLESLFTVTDDRPAIQQELQGSGILSLIPLIRHGTLFSGYVLDRLADEIAAMPKPTDAKSRKAFATLKVLRSRASSHLAKDRDYSLYLALWAARQTERTLQPSGQIIAFRSTFSLKTNLSELDTYKQILPDWISPNKPLEGINRQAPVYDPYQLESGRTDDPYWNEIQVSLIEHRYMHPLLVLYWAYRIFQWSLSSRTAVATIEGLLDKCSLGSNLSPDAIFSVWISLFHLGRGKSPQDESDVEFIQRVEEELSSQQRLQIRK